MGADLQEAVHHWTVELDRRLSQVPWDERAEDAWRAGRHEVRRALLAEVAGAELPALVDSRSLAWLCDGDAVPMVCALMELSRQAEAHSWLEGVSSALREVLDDARLADDPGAVAELRAERDPDGPVPCKWPNPCTCDRCVDDP